jgi:hypothetical protein
MVLSTQGEEFLEGKMALYTQREPFFKGKEWF